MLDEGDVVSLSPKARTIQGVLDSMAAGPQISLPGYLERGVETFSGRISGNVERRDIPFVVDETAIVEFYAR